MLKTRSVLDDFLYSYFSSGNYGDYGFEIFFSRPVQVLAPPTLKQSREIAFRAIFDSGG